MMTDSTTADLGKGRATPLARKQRLLLAVTVTAAVASTGGLVASTWVKSPAQVSAEASAPPATVLTAGVERRMLSTTLVMRGAFVGGSQYKFTPTSVARSANGPGGGLLVVTAVQTQVGAAVEAGKVLLEVAERPVYALPGAFPAYRDMLPGETGDDIAALQAGLAALGFASSDRRGYFGAGTKSAVTRFYQYIGYPIPLTDASKSANGGSGGTNGSPSAGSATAGPPTPSATGRSPSRGASSGTRSAAAFKEPLAAVSAVGIAARSGAIAAASPAPSASAGAPGGEAAPEPMVPLSEVAFLPSLPARVAAISARVGGTVAASDPLLTFTTGGLSLVGKLPPENGPLVKPGMRASVLAEATGFTADGTVSGIGEKTTTGAGTANESTYTPLTIAGATAWPQQLEGEDVRVTITTASTSGEVLAVPQAAISSSADGRTSVTVAVQGEVKRTVEVTTGASADGFVEVTPVNGALAPGDKVVTGR